jgi:hypothetical protein
VAAARRYGAIPDAGGRAALVEAWSGTTTTSPGLSFGELAASFSRNSSALSRS